MSIRRGRIKTIMNLIFRNFNEYNSQRRVATGNPVVFTLSPPECYMEIQNGYGIGGPRVTGPVRVGDPLTLIIYMRSKYGKFLNKFYTHFH